MHPRLRSLSAVTALAFVACSPEITPPQPSPSSLFAGEAPIVADSAQYTLARTSTGWQGKIGYQFTNGTDQVVSILNCNGDYALRLEKWEDGAWVNAFAPAVTECLSPPIQVTPGSAIRDELEIFAGPTGSDLYPQFMVADINGTYRLVIESAYWNYTHTGPNWGEKLSLEQRVSNTFEIRTR